MLLNLIRLHIPTRVIRLQHSLPKMATACIPFDRPYSSKAAIITKRIEQKASRSALRLLIKSCKFEELIHILQSDKTIQTTDFHIIPNQVIADIHKSRGLKPNAELNALEIAKLPNVETAERFIRESPSSIYVYNAILLRYAKAGDTLNAENCLETLRKAIMPNYSTYRIMIRLYNLVRDIGKVEFYFHEMISVGMKPKGTMHNFMINAHLKNRNIERAEHYFNEMIKARVKPNVLTYGSMIVAHNLARNIDKAEHHYNQMIKNAIIPDMVTFTSMILSHTLARNVGKAEHYFHEMVKAGIKPNEIAFNSIIDGHKKAKNFGRVEFFFDEMVKAGITPNIKTYNSMMHSLAVAKNVTRVEHCFFEMKKNGIEPDMTTYNSLIDVHRRAVNIKRVEHYFQQMINGGIKPDAISTTGSAHDAAGSFGSDQQYFDEPTKAGIKPDLKVYKAMIKAHAMVKDIEMVEHYFNDMISAGIKPDALAYASMIQSHAIAKDIEKVEFYYHDMIIAGHKPHFAVYASMIHAHYVAGNISEMEYYNREMTGAGYKRTLTLYNFMIHAYAFKGDVSGLYRLLKSMKVDSVAPDIVGWTSVMDGFSRSGNYRVAIMIWKALIGTITGKEKRSLSFSVPVMVPTSATISIVLDVCKHGNLIEYAVEIWGYAQRTCTTLNSNTLTSYIECLIQHGRATVAVDLVLMAIQGKGLPHRLIIPDQKTLQHTRSMLWSRGYASVLARFDNGVMIHTREADCAQIVKENCFADV